MAAILGDIAKYCNGLSSERGTERKSSVSKLLERLKDVDVQNAIDTSSASNSKKRVSWDMIAQSVFSYVTSEADSLKGASKLTEETISKRAKDISETFRSVIQVAEKRGPVLKSGDVFHHIWCIMCDERTRKWFCNEYTSVLVKNLLSVEIHVDEITAKIWHDLVYVYCKCILMPPRKGDTSLFAQALNQLTTVAKNLTHVRGKDLFKFFSDVFKDVRNDRNETVIFHLVSALNNFSMNVAPDNRGQLCILGEDLFPLLLPLWNKTSAQVKDKLIDFFRLQVDIHHPYGVHHEDNGAWSSNEEFWKKCLKKLHEKISNEFHLLAGKLKWSGSKTELAQKSNFIELAVGTYHQIFYLSSQSQREINDASMNQIIESESGSSRKKRKTESGWQSILDGISMVSCPLACIAWLQFFSSYIDQHSSSFPSSEYLNFLNRLQQTMVNCKRPDILSYILQALRSVAEKANMIRNENSHFINGKEVETCWRNIWFETLKAIHSRNVDESGFLLLTPILKANLFIPLQDTFNVFFSSGTRITRESLQFVICLLQRFPVPDKLSNNMEVFSGFERSSKFQARKKMIELILPDVETTITRKNFNMMLSSRSSDADSASAVVVLSLLRKSPSTFSRETEFSSNWTGTDCIDDQTKIMKKIADIYLKSTFCTLAEKSSTERKQRLNTKQTVRLIPELCEYLSRRVAELKDDVLNLLRDEDFCKTTNYLCNWLHVCFKYTSLLLNILALLLMKSDTSLESLQNSVAVCVKMLLSTARGKINALYSDGNMKEETRNSTILSIFSSLNHVFQACCSSYHLPQKMAFVFTSSFFDIAFDIMSGQLPPPSKQATRLRMDDFGSSSGSSTTLGDFDDLMDGTNKISCTQRPYANQNQSKGIQNTLYDISEAQSVRIEASKFLFQFAFDEKEETAVRIREKSLRDSILDFLDEKFDSSKMMYFEMLKNIVHDVNNDVIILPSSDMEVVFECIRKFVSENRSNQSACLEGLKLLRDLIKFLKPSGQRTEEQLEQMRLIANKIVSAFWMLKGDKYSPEVRLMLLECLVKMMQIDPAGVWSKIDTPKRGKNTVSKCEGPCSLEDCLLQFLADRSHVVRLRAAEHVTNLFQMTDSHKPQSPLQQLNAFSKIADALTELIIIKDDITEDELEDVSANRAATLLFVLKTVACSSSVCEKKAIALLFHDYKEKFLDIKLVGKVFREIASEKGFQDPRIYLKEHLGFLCNDWVKRGFPITDFPSSVIHTEITAFLRSFAREIIPYLLFYRDQSTFEKIKEKLQLQDPWVELLIDNFDRIIVFSLPFYACQSKRMQKGLEEETKMQEMEAERKKAKLAYEFLENCLTKEVIEKLVVKRFDDIIIELLLRMFDPPSEDSDASQFMRDTDAAPNPPYFTSYAIRGTLEYLAACHRNKSIVEVLSLKKDSTQKILLALSTNIANAKSEREKVRVLCAYRLFVLLLLDDVQSGLGSNWAYFLRDVIYRCCHWLNWHFHNGSDDAFFLCVYQVLQKVTESSLVSCYQEFGCHVIKVVNTLTKYAKRGHENGRRALHLLRFIVLENSEIIRDALIDLPPFPDTPMFQQLSKRLENLKKESSTRNSFEDFKILCQQSLVSIEAVKSLLQILKMDRTFVQRFIEINSDGNITVLTVVSYLLELALAFGKPDENDTDIQLAIGRCLDNFLKEDEEYFGSNKIAYRYHVIMDCLSNLLTNESPDVVSAAAVALKDALHTKAGIQHLNVFDVGKCEKPKFFLYCEPFKPSRSKKGSQSSQQYLPPSVQDFVALVGGTNLWEPGVMSFDEWIKELSSTLITSGAVEDAIFTKVAPVCKLNVSFAELVLPFLVHNILLNCNNELKLTISSLFNRFFSSYLTKHDLTLKMNAGKPGDPDQKATKIGDKEKAARTFINVVNYLRRQDKPAQSARNANTKWDNNFWLDIKYLELAQMAFECSSHFAAVMFTEIWCDVQRANSRNILNSDSISSSQGTQFEELSDQSGDSADKASCQRLLFEAYRSIGEPDAMYGVGTGYSTDVHTRVKAYEYEEDFGKALLTQDLQMDAEGSSSSLALAQNLERAGLHHVLFTYMRGLDKRFIRDLAAYEELQLESCWRNGNWDMDDQPRSPYQDTTTFSGNLYDSIIALKEGDENVFESLINEARLNLLRSDEIGGNVSTSCLYKFLAKMSAVTELESYGKQYFNKDIMHGTRKCTLSNDFRYYELSLSLKATALKATLNKEVAKNEQQNSMKDDIAREAYSHLMRSAILAREAGRYQVCERHLNDISNLESTVRIPSDWKIEQARMFWDRGEKSRAMYHLKSLIKSCEKGKDQSIAELYPITLGLYGHWLAETRSENPGIIIENYMEHAACLLEDSQSTRSENPSEAYYLLAKYADSQYEGIKDYIKSSAFESKQSVIKKVKDEINRLDAMTDSPRVASNNRYYRSLVAQCEEDEKELQQMVKDRKQFLQKALENYTRCLCIGDKYDLRIFRLCSLWLENSHEISVNQIIKKCISTIESRKFIPLMYQLAARLGSAKNKDNKLFNENLENLLEKVAKEHPFHVTVIIMALCNVEEETPAVNPSSKRSKLSRKAANEKNLGAEKSRIHSAKAVLAKLKSSNPSLIESMEMVMNAYIELAYYDIQHLKRQTGKFELPSKLLIRRLKDMKNFAMPTLDIPVDPSCKYTDVVYISSFDNTFTHCGGINLPKVITCIGSDGKRRRQLVKGKDDLRQDAVMQQVFGMVNKLLKENTETRKRQLRIRTYKVVPLSQRSGIVEWCENTFPLGEYLIGNRVVGGAHIRYHPTDWTAVECRKKFTDAANSNGKKSRYDALQDIMTNFRPVFRHFFYEKFTDPVEWFTRRLAYTRSLASTSIVGYVVGLGDRHVQNILIDFITAELVHIDLGIAFEQGKQLPTPETIPFRLTRDLVDGMGIAGVEGVFRRCCEKVMELMRSSQEAIQTIVEVLLYDPLYVWTLSPLKAVQVQQKTTDDVGDTYQNMNTLGDANLDNLLGELQSVQPQDHSKNKMAQRVLIRLKQKLDGNEGGCFLGTEGQVNFLIQSARDPKNLCRLFPGWQPWL